MENPTPQPPPGLPDVEGIANLDTARMTLRWALERLQALEKEKAEAQGLAKAAERAKLKALEEVAAAQRALALRTAQELERQGYYHKVQEFLDASLGGKLDVGELAKREIAVRNLQELLEQQRTGLEKEYGARAAGLEAEWRKRTAELEQDARAAALQADRQAAARRTALESEHLGKAAELREREIAVKREEEALSERRARFEDYYASQRARLHAEVRNFREEISAEVKLRSEITERLMSERQASLEEGFGRERAILLKELASWRAKAQELGPRLLELEKDLDVAEEAVRRSRSAADRQTLILADYQQSWEAEKAGLEAEIVNWKEKSRAQLAKVIDLGKRLALAEESLQQTQGAAEQQFALLEEHRKAQAGTLERAAAELREARRREAEALKRLAEAGLPPPA